MTTQTISHRQFALLNKAWRLYEKLEKGAYDIYSRPNLAFNKAVDRLEALPKAALLERMNGGVGWEKA